MQKHFIIAYDISDAKRSYRVRKLLYDYATGGQKSALEVPLGKQELLNIVSDLKPLLKDNDRVNIIEVEMLPVIFGKSEILEYDKGVVIV